MDKSLEYGLFMGIIRIMDAIGIIACGTIAGLAGAVLMNLFLRWVGTSFEEPVNMVRVLGSFVTKSRETGVLAGTIIHLVFGVVFGVLYAWILVLIGAAAFPNSLFAGLGMGFAHGLLSSYAMMFVMDEKHPIGKYRNATFSIGLLYLIAHGIYGAVMGLSVGILFAAIG
jgi:uncharacterized membrane protein (DUF485 family)